MSNNNALLENILHMADDEVDSSDPDLSEEADVKVVIDYVQSQEFPDQEKGDLTEKEPDSLDFINSEAFEDVNLVELFRNLMDIGAQIKIGIEHAIKKEQAEKAKKAEQGDNSESEEELEEEENEELSNENYEENEDDESEDEDDEDNDVKIKVSNFPVVLL